MNNLNLLEITSKFPTDRFRSAGAVSVHGGTAGKLVRLGLLEKRLIDPRLGLCASWEYRRISSSKPPLIVLRNALTGLFFNGVNFAEEGVLNATRVGEVNEDAVRSIWGPNTQVIRLTEEQLDSLTQAAKLTLRSKSHEDKGRKNAAANLLNKAKDIYLTVFSSFPPVGSRR